MFSRARIFKAGFSKARWQTLAQQLMALSLLAAGLPALAEFESSAPAEPMMAEPVTAELWLSPRSCLPANGDAPCVEQLRVRWRTNGATPICVWQRGAPAPLFCAEQASGERELQLPIRTSTRFDLLQQSSQLLLASAEILVMAKPDTGKRRRYQHPWSIF